jgi:hypothetical protein
MEGRAVGHNFERDPPREKNFFIQATIHVFLRSWSHQNVILDRKQ